MRRGIRYHGYDYSMAGYYALTICARDKAHVLGVLLPDEPLQLSLLGELALRKLLTIPTHYPTVQPDTWVLLPNHLHQILVLTRNQVVAVSEVVGSFKARCYGQ